MIAGRKKVIVIGGGFAGVQFVQTLDESFFDILLIDKLNHHQFQPLFYQVATSQIEPSNISFPLRNVFKGKKNLKIRMTELLSVDVENKSITTGIGNFSYDYLVIATGCKTNFFGNKEIEKHALTLKTTYEAITVRNKILETFENILSADDDLKKKLLNLVIVGGGPSGVELAGAFAEVKKNFLPKDYPGIDFSKFNVILIEGNETTLSSMSLNARMASMKYLRELGVELILDAHVVNYDGEKLIYKPDGKDSAEHEIFTQNVIWVAGITGVKIPGIADENYVRNNRILVNRFNKIEKADSIYAIGDISFMVTPNYPNGHPQVANVAINQAKLLAKNLKAIELNRNCEEYEYVNLGSMATIGTRKAVVDMPVYKFKGYFAWVVWMFLHLMLILSVKNKLIIFINWAWKFITRDTSLRLILKGNDVK